MAGYSQGVNTFVPTDYSAEQLAIDRRRKLSDSLLGQSQEPLNPGQTAGGYVIPISPYAGLAKMLQAGVSAYGNKRADEQEKALAAKYQQDLGSTISQSQAALAGSPAMPEQAPATPNDDNGYANPPVAASAAVAPNPQLAASLLMQHPATQGIGMQQIQAEMSRQQTQQRLKDALSMTGGSPGAASGAAPAVGAPNPMASLPPQIVALMTSGDPELVALGKSLLEANKGIAQRPGAPVVNPYTGQVIAQPTPSVPAGVQLNIGPNGPTASPVPGAAPAMGGAAAAVTRAQEGARAEYGTGLTAVPVYLPGGDQITVNLNAVQMHEYNTTGKLPADVAASIPGYNAAPQQPSPAPQPGIPGGKPISPEAQTQFASVGLNQIPAAERPMAEAVMNASAQGQPLTLRGPQPAAPAGTGRPVVGRGQSQSEQITQKRQEAGGKAVDEAFGKDYVSFIQGGASDAAKQISQLGDVVKALGDEKNNLSGPVVGRVPDFVRNFTNPQAVAMRERVEEVVQRSLRAILGAQFTEKEGERLISRAYNPSQQQGENAIRVGRLLTQLQQAFAAKQDAAKYYAQNGTLQGWNGKLPSASDFDPDAVVSPATGWKITPMSGT